MPSAQVGLLPAWARNIGRDGRLAKPGIVQRVDGVRAAVLGGGAVVDTVGSAGMDGSRLLTP